MSHEVVSREVLLYFEISKITLNLKWLFSQNLFLIWVYVVNFIEKDMLSKDNTYFLHPAKT